MLNRFISFGVKRARLAFGSALLLPLFCAVSARASLPGIIASSTVQLATGLGAPAKVVVDPLGNVFTADAGGSVYEIPVAGGPAVKVLTGLGGNTGLAIDAVGDVIVTDTYNGHVYLYPNQNGTLNVTGRINLANALGGLDGYYASFADVAVSGSLVYASVSYCNGSCNSAGKTAIFSVTADGKTGAVVLPSLPGGLPAYSLAADNAGHLYYADGANVYSVDLTAKTLVPVIIGTGLLKPAGVQVDTAGNVYISDTGHQRVVVIPNESGALNPADQYTLASIANVPYGVGIDGAGNLYSGDKYATSSVNKTTIGGAGFGASPVGTASKNVNVSFTFNAPYTPAQVALAQGQATSTEFTNIFGGNCKPGTMYTAGQSCTVQLGFLPGTTGSRSGAVSLLDGTGNTLGVAYLFGTGVGAALTIDPGTQTPLTGVANGAAYNTPTAVSYDASGNLYTADSGANLVFVTPAGSTAATSTIGSGLKNPGGVSVDGAGNVFVADTGNNRIVEIPNESGILNTAHQSVVATGLTGPTGIRVSANGTIYVADTGSGRVLRFVTSLGAGNYVQSTLIPACTTTVKTNCLTAPAGVTTDAAGNLYVSDRSLFTVTAVNLLSGLQTTVAIKLGTPTAVGVDAANNLYVVEFGNKDVIRIANVGGTLATSGLTIGQGLSIPTGIAVNGAGNVIIADSGKPAVYRLVRTGGLLDLGRVNLALSGAPQQITVTSAGNLDATLGTPPYAATGATANFQNSGSPNNPCTDGLALPIGTTCGVSAVFAPVATGQLTETLTFSSNALNAPGITATVTGFGTNLSSTQTVLSLIAPTTASISFGQTITVSAAVTTARAGVVPSGPVTFFVDGVAKPPVVLSGTAPYVATLTLGLAANNQLTAGTHIINASYGGDTLNASSNASAPLTLVINRVAAPTTLSHVVIVNAVPATLTLPMLPRLLVPTPNFPVTQGSRLTYLLTVTPAVNFAPGGTITLYTVGSTIPVGSGPLVPSAGSSVATAEISIITPAYPGVPGPLGIGQYQLYASYSGDTNYLPSDTSSALSPVIVTVPDYNVGTTNSSLQVKAGQTVTTMITLQTVGGFGGSSLGANAIIQYACSTLPAYAHCNFQPGFSLINSFNANDATANATALPSPLTGSQQYGSDANFQNTYNIMLTIQTDVPPPLASGIFWPASFLGLGLLSLAARRKFNAQRGRLALLSTVCLFGAVLGVTGCSTKNNFGVTTPGGTSAFTIDFHGLETGTPGVPAQTITGYSVANNIVTFTGANTFQQGRNVTITALKIGTQFNGQTFTVLPGGLSAASWSAVYTGASIAQTTDAGTATATYIAHSIPFQLTVN